MTTDLNLQQMKEPGEQDLPALVQYLRERVDLTERALNASREEVESFNGRMSRLHEFARRQDEQMDDAANDGLNAVPPTGDDWNDLFGAVKECVGELGSSLAQQGPTPETAGFPMPDDRYVACKGDSCPFCGASGPIGQSWNTENGVASQEMSCNECDREWVDIYNLGGYQAV